jgi:hypothetical protein
MAVENSMMNIKSQQKQMDAASGRHFFPDRLVANFLLTVNLAMIIIQRIPNFLDDFREAVVTDAIKPWNNERNKYSLSFSLVSGERIAVNAPTQKLRRWLSPQQFFARRHATTYRYSR